MNATDDVSAYALLIRVRIARGRRMERALFELYQAHKEKIRIEQQLLGQHEADSLNLMTHVQHVNAILSSREITKPDTILRERAHIDVLGEIRKRAHAECERAAADVRQSIDSCNDMRHRIVNNEERVSTLRMQEKKVRMRLASKADDLEEEEQEEAFAAGQIGRHRKAFP